jgi:signal peptide peptidase SppA
VDAVRAGTLKPKADYGDDDDEDTGPLYQLVNGIAVIAIEGQMTKRGSSFGGCSTVAVRCALREAAKDYQVRGVILHICSPGGTVAGTSDLADDVLAVRAGLNGAKPKPVFAYIADLGCSAAYWVASQCERIYANTTAIVGSIGTYAVLEDDSGMQQQLGIKYRVVSTGKYKGLGADGVVTDELVADVQREVDELNMPFLAAVQSGRGDAIPDIAVVSDGRSYVAANALELGLIDEVESFDLTMQAISTEVKSMTAESFRQHAAENSEAAEVKEIEQRGYKRGVTSATESETARFKAIRDACGSNDTLAADLFLAGKDADDAKLTLAAMAKSEAKAKADADAAAAAIAAKDAEIERLKALAGTQGPIGTPAPKADPVNDPAATPEQKARAEWAANKDNCHDTFISEKVYVSARIREIAGK